MPLNWYAAHVVMSVRFKDGIQDHFPVWENIILISAPDVETGFAKAEEYARLDEGDCDNSFIWKDRPATWVFAGVRKLVDLISPDQQPDDMTEITYSELTFNDEETLQKFVDGKRVILIREAEFRDKE